MYNGSLHVPGSICVEIVIREKWTYKQEICWGTILTGLAWSGFSAKNFLDTTDVMMDIKLQYAYFYIIHISSSIDILLLLLPFYLKFMNNVLLKYVFCLR